LTLNRAAAAAAAAAVAAAAAATAGAEYKTPRRGAAYGRAPWACRAPRGRGRCPRLLRGVAFFRGASPLLTLNRAAATALAPGAPACGTCGACGGIAGASSRRR
jgi:hypothetical protein